MQHINLYKQVGRYGGWPANYGIWSWGDEIVVSFIAGHFKNQVKGHAIDHDQPTQTMQARSLDGGVTWDVQPAPMAAPDNKGLSADEHVNPHLKIGNPFDAAINVPQPCPGNINFAHPDFGLMCARTGLVKGAISWFYVTYDRCHSWEGPYKLPMFNQLGIAARTAYLVTDQLTCMLFLTSTKPDGGEGRVFCARTNDGGKSFKFVSWVGPENPPGFTIMPAVVRLENGRIIAALRQRAPDSYNIPVYASDDEGQTWQNLSEAVTHSGKGGNPPAMIQMQDGRVCLIYGYRDAPFGIRAKLSDDGGKTWCDEIILRDDAGNGDLGYPRITQRSDGTIVAVYYYNDDPNTERYIGATLWNPNEG